MRHNMSKVSDLASAGAQGLQGTTTTYGLLAKQINSNYRFGTVFETLSKYFGDAGHFSEQFLPCSYPSVCPGVVAVMNY